MTDWFRSLLALGTAFVSVVILTIWLATIIVPGAPGLAQAPGATATGSVDTEGPGENQVPTAAGGTLMVSGDRQGTFTVDRESTDGRYALVGDQGRIFFAGEPLAVEQISFDGLTFILEPDACALEPGDREDSTGVAPVRLRCDAIEDVRGNGVITLDGTVAVSADVLGMRGDLPSSGGTVSVGDETIELSEAVISVGPQPALVSGGYLVYLLGTDGASSLTFRYEPRTHELTLDTVGLSGGIGQVPEDACAISMREIGVLNPRSTVVELSIRCDSVDMPGLGPAPIAGSIIVDWVEG